MYVGSEDNNLYAINPDGTLKWAFTTGTFIEGAPAVGRDGTIYIGSWDNKLYAVNPDGTQQWAFTAQKLFDSSPTIGPEGTIYAGSWDGNLYALNSTSLGLANSSWPMFLHDARHTGRIPTGNTSSINLLLLD